MKIDSEMAKKVARNKRKVTIVRGSSVGDGRP